MRRKILLLQGPVGPFFYGLSQDLEKRGYQVQKINFNGGDDCYYPDGEIYRFTEGLERWEDYFTRHMKKHKPNCIILFGDCRGQHRVAVKVAKALSVPCFVFEEGYYRPNYITFQYGGVNGHSQLDFALSNNLLATQQEFNNPITYVGKQFWHAAFHACRYYIAASGAKARYPHYQHHRPLKVSEGYYWILGALKKCKNWLPDHMTVWRLPEKSYYVVALQLHNDSQVLQHSDYESVEQFILETLNNFASTHRSHGFDLVIKSHPLDRGYKNYRPMVMEEAKKLNIAHRVHYLDEANTAQLVRRSRGVVTINSTVGLLALENHVPCLPMGQAIYKQPGLTHQGGQTSFWVDAQVPDAMVYNAFKRMVVTATQVNGNFYKPLSNSQYHSGLSDLELIMSGLDEWVESHVTPTETNWRVVA